MKHLFLLCLSLLSLTACGQQNTVSAPIANTWLGKWDGPEGTSLTIAPTAKGYSVTIQNLDGPRTFPLIAKGEVLTFTRDGTTEHIRTGSGAETGMKWLAQKKSCVVIKTGEGYCR